MCVTVLVYMYRYQVLFYMKGRKIKRLHFWTNQRQGIVQVHRYTVHSSRKLLCTCTCTASVQVVNVCHVVPLYNLVVGSTYIHV